MRHIALVVVVGALVLGCSSKRAKTADDPTVSPWFSVGIGSVFESKTVTRMQQPFTHESETTTRQTLVSRTDKEASIKLEIIDGAATTVQDVKVPRRQSPATMTHDGSTVATADETCTVPAGTFECTRMTQEIQQGDVIRSTVTWRAKKIPVPIKAVVTNENMTMTTELTRISIAK
jgi:hypothetical protein